MSTKTIAASRRRKNAPKSKRGGKQTFRMIDLFAGIGGTRLGLESIGGQCVWTSEWDRFSQQTYRENFGNKHPLCGDIREVDETEIPPFDVLVGGFPCQPFSIAGVSKKNSLGKPHGFQCKTQGTLFFDIARIIAHHRPAAFVLENVKNLLSHRQGETFGVIRETLESELGYEPKVHVVRQAVDLSAKLRGQAQSQGQRVWLRDGNTERHCADAFGALLQRRQ